MLAGRKRVFVLGGLGMLVAALSGCATSASTWQRPGANADTIAADLSACKGAAATAGYGTMGVTFDDYVIRCMEAKGYRPSM